MIGARYGGADTLKNRMQARQDVGGGVSGAGIGLSSVGGMAVWLCWPLVLVAARACQAGWQGQTSWRDITRDDIAD
jgi:hypothetical protein